MVSYQESYRYTRVKKCSASTISLFIFRCMFYTGSACNTNLVYLSHGQTQHQVEKTLIKTINQIRFLTSPHCLKHVIRFLCRQHYPSCSLNTNQKPRKVCREDCHELEKRTCRRDVRKLGFLWRRIITCAKLPSALKQPEANCQKVFGKCLVDKESTFRMSHHRNFETFQCPPKNVPTQHKRKLDPLP